MKYLGIRFLTKNNKTKYEKHSNLQIHLANRNGGFKNKKKLKPKEKGN